MRSTKKTGSAGEKVAKTFLVRKGFSIITTNYRKPTGEVDIIALKNGVVRFVEVKSVSRESLEDISREKGEYRPEEMVHKEKLRKIARTAEWYMAEHKDRRDYEIDVVGVYLDLENRKARCRLFEQVL